jgi:YjbE family integral membrane protein
MGADGAFQYLGLTLNVFLVDVLLSGDNAVVIALACRALPAHQKRQGMLLGAGAAIAMRVMLALVAGAFLQIPSLKLLGGLALIGIAIQLIIDGGLRDGTDLAEGKLARSTTSLSSVVLTIVVADVVMSTDNVIALAAVAQGNVAVLALGLSLSVPFLMGGSWYVSSLLVRLPSLVPLGGAMLGWFGGSIASSDVLYADWVDHQSPALHVAVPALCALYVLLQARIMAEARGGAMALRPTPRIGHPVESAPRADLVAVADATPSSVIVAPGGARVEWHRATLLRWGLGATGVAGAIGLGVLAWNTQWLPTPAKLVRYECSNGAYLYYRIGGQRIAASVGDRRVTGVVLSNNLIDWGNLHAASMKLGTVPPTHVIFGSAQTLRVDGGLFDGQTCNAR